MKRVAIFSDGWKRLITYAWIDGMLTYISDSGEDICLYQYNSQGNWSLDENDKPIISFYANKIHKNGFYKWTHPVHEILSPIKEESSIVTNNIIINHYPDVTKSRSNYLTLLELSVNFSST